MPYLLDGRLYVDLRLYGGNSGIDKVVKNKFGVKMFLFATIFFSLFEISDTVMKRLQLLCLGILDGLLL